MSLCRRQFNPHLHWGCKLQINWKDVLLCLRWLWMSYVLKIPLFHNVFIIILILNSFIKKTKNTHIYSLSCWIGSVLSLFLNDRLFFSCLLRTLKICQWDHFKVYSTYDKYCRCPVGRVFVLIFQSVMQNRQPLLERDGREARGRDNMGASEMSND